MMRLYSKSPETRSYQFAFCTPSLPCKNHSENRIAHLEEILADQNISEQNNYGKGLRIYGGYTDLLNMLH